MVGLCCFSGAWSAAAKTIFVAAHGNDRSDGLTEASSLLSLQEAANRTEPGDTVLVAEGSYAPFVVKQSGTDDAWIRFAPQSGAKPKIVSQDWNAILIKSAHHIEIQGFDVRGAMASRSLAQCTADADAPTPDPLCNGNGISVDGRNQIDKPHHLRFINNEVHDCPGAGISAISADYVTVENNFIHDNSFHTRYATSGISIFYASNSDDQTNTKIFVLRNRVFGNKTLVKWPKIGRLSDGNGIIIDTSRNDDPGVDQSPYRGRFLVANNLSVGNGGSGIHAFRSDHVDIVHNTTYENGQVVGYAEIFARQCTDVRLMNNIAWSLPGGRANSNDNASSNITYDYNVYYGGAVTIQGPHDILANPNMVAPSLRPEDANFQLLPDSVAIDSASPDLTFSQDIAEVSRPSGTNPDRGAYEFYVPRPNDSIPVAAGGDRSDTNDGCSCRYVVSRGRSEWLTAAVLALVAAWRFRLNKIKRDSLSIVNHTPRKYCFSAKNSRKK